MTFAELLAAFDAEHPDSVMVAAEHRYGCTCPPCISLGASVLNWADYGEPPAEWAELLAEQVTEDGPTPDQLERWRKLCDEWT